MTDDTIDVRDATLAGVASLEAENARLREEVAQLQEALDSRVVIEQAKGLVAGAARVDMGQAFDFLRVYARSSNRNLHELCIAVIDVATAPPSTGPAPDQPTASPVRLSRTPLYAEIMECWRERPRSFLRHRKVPSPW